MVKLLHNRKTQVFIFQAIICTIAFTIFPCLAKENQADKIPARNNRVNDFEHVFTLPEIGELEALVQKIAQETALEIAVVTLDTTLTTNAGFDSTTLYIANKWGIGKKVNNNGILIGFSKSLQKIRIENGFGIEKKISKEQTGRIIDSVMTPYFSKNNSYEGIRRGILALYDKTKYGSD